MLLAEWAEYFRMKAKRMEPSTPKPPPDQSPEEIMAILRNVKVPHK